MGGRIGGDGAVHQVVGFLAVGAAAAALLHSWDVPKGVSGGVLLLCLAGAALTGLEPTVRPDGTSEPVPINAVQAMPPTEGRVAANRHTQAPTGAVTAW